MVRTNGRRLEEKEEEGVRKGEVEIVLILPGTTFFHFPFKMPYQGGSKTHTVPHPACLRARAVPGNFVLHPHYNPIYSKITKN
jgi:hypothetical protein